MEKNDLITVTCERLGSNGEGVARTDECMLFVPGFLPGEKALVRILAVKGGCAYGKIAELYTPAEQRVRPVCGVFGKCGGCQLQHMRYRAQLAFKTELVKNTLKKIGAIDVDVPLCIKSEKQYGYRNKLTLPIGQKDGKTVVGFYRERSHKIVETDECPITGWAGKVIEAVKSFCGACGLDGYDEETGKGQLRHIAVREIGKQYIVVLVSTERELKGIGYLLERLDRIFKEYSFFLNVNQKNTNVIFGDEFILLKGSETYECEECGITFEAGANTFVQINEDVRQKLYQGALEAVSSEDTVIDCYSGGGLLTAMFAKKCRRAYGIELVKEAVECADRLRERNGLTDKMFNRTGKVEEELPALLKEEKSAVVVLDPPRAGLGRKVVSTLIESGAEKIIMISCNPATLARDLGLLTGTLKEEGAEIVKADSPQGAYEIVSVQPYDMFPQTKHVETLVVLKRKAR